MAQIKELGTDKTKNKLTYLKTENPNFDKSSQEKKRLDKNSSN